MIGRRLAGSVGPLVAAGAVALDGVADEEGEEEFPPQPARSGTPATRAAETRSHPFMCPLRASAVRRTSRTFVAVVADRRRNDASPAVLAIGCELHAPFRHGFVNSGIPDELSRRSGES